MIVPKNKHREHNVVLVADDNTFVRFLVKKWLGTEAEIIEVGTGPEVLPAYQKSQPDLVFLDIHLPGKNGKDVLADLIAHDADAFVVMLSADSNKDNVVTAVRNGAKAFITKPFMRDTLHKYFMMCPNIHRPEVAAETDGEKDSWKVEASAAPETRPTA